jgi:hypothetical protein
MLRRRILSSVHLPCDNGRTTCDPSMRPGGQAGSRPSHSRSALLPGPSLKSYLATCCSSTANAKQDIPMDSAIARWMQHIVRWTDHGTRRRERIRGPTVPHLILSDTKTLNSPVRYSDKGRRTSDMFFPEYAPTDRLEVKLAALKWQAKSRLDFSAAENASGMDQGYLGSPL